MLIGKVLIFPFVSRLINRFGLRMINVAAFCLFTIAAILRIGIMISINFVYLS